jgi:hypothetical protein
MEIKEKTLKLIEIVKEHYPNRETDIIINDKMRFTTGIKPNILDVIKHIPNQVSMETVYISKDRPRYIISFNL